MANRASIDGFYSQYVMANNDIIKNQYNPSNTDSLEDCENKMNESDIIKAALHSANLYSSKELDIYNKDYRYGMMNRDQEVGRLQQVLFFTKPDLNIMYRSEINGQIVPGAINSALDNDPYFADLWDKRPELIPLLQESYRTHSLYTDNFNHLLQNAVTSSLEIPSLEGTVTESPVNNYGVGFQYRGSSEASDDSIDFSLEFKDTKYLDVYHFFKAYEVYETLKHHGLVGPTDSQVINRVIHDQFSIYKFMLADDLETIVYYCKLYGVMPMNLPRDVFSNEEFTNGLSYTINFKAAFFEEMNYQILRDFNYLSRGLYDSLKYEVPVYNEVFGTTDFRAAKAAIVKAVKIDSGIGRGKCIYKLKWKGDDAI